ncbi:MULTISPECIES: division/cell wall cluster transcriptional repressor MraZ [unclassified Oceanobacter]|uniref:division/cell wall cluster transcriptional repressor MraZ n=1 Tax=unclassified Oceanobacter TaxID=2620260 RepID=UPI0026E46202|nr:MULTISPECIES: division/cell wall cluster transcriptional repressor MraZ [unclassified Oceanobacter]MDO6682273.1 division/cell wall cluster transcriptional repressor MraZ [Oceanobacter sp. 5_MG-2023]MDP2506294.1 division/cell wall cluster transcriptional repressor MraZ [Oceanobacter sp. 3_MG-2023]MDP2546445.1 division/cell wall cluster transcriptional repressor MraZ [Oceanobacter sp. 4_MG-2023]MDP2609954.1 division/cell wall cluster transcriptional repressor MraZ [Oceanobacter sp. 1_MG-2023]
MHHINLDAKGRLAIPAKVREALEEQEVSVLVVTVDSQDSCLLVYPLAEWVKIEAKLDQLPTLNPATKKLKRLLQGHATECSADGSGRILISPACRQYAGLIKECVLMGQGNKLELWDKARWETQLNDYLEQPMSLDTLPDELKSLSI